MYTAVIQLLYKNINDSERANSDITCVKVTSRHTTVT